MLDPRRAAVVAEAETWLKTPYHHMGRIKGVGVDCLTLLAEVYEAAGIIPHVELEFYPPDWNLHRDAERYLIGVMQHAREFVIEPPSSNGRAAVLHAADRGSIPRGGTKPAPEPGDVAIFKFGRCYAHGVIVTKWPLMIHSWVDGGVGVMRGDVTQPLLYKRQMRLFDPF